MALLPKLKIKSIPQFPANIIGGDGIEVTKEHGHVTVDLAHGEFPLISAVPTSPTNSILTYDPATDVYANIPSSLLGGAVAGISDAPVDSVLYGRRNAGWTPAAPIASPLFTGDPRAPTPGFGDNDTSIATTAFVTSAVAPATSFIQSGTGAVTRTMLNKARDVVNVLDFGADPTGVADSSSAFNNAIASLPVTGGTVNVPTGNFRIATTIQIGDGSATAKSTRNGVRLVGTGLSPGVDDYFARNTRLNWVGASNGVMIQVSGPIRGIEVSNLYLDCNNVAGIGLLMLGANNFRTDHLSIIKARNVAYYLTGYSAAAVSTTAACSRGDINRLEIIIGDVANAMGIFCDGVVDPNPDFSCSTCFVYFIGVTIYPSQTHRNDCILVKVADTVYFNDTLIFPRPYVTNTNGFVFDYSGGSPFPCGINITGYDCGSNMPPANQFMIYGTPSTIPNFINCVSPVNGGKYPKNLLNSFLDLPKKMAVDVEVFGSAAAIAPTIIHIPQDDGVWRVNYYMVTSGGGTGGHMAAHIRWQDETSFQIQALPLLDLAVAFAKNNGSVIMHVKAGFGISYQTAFDGTGAAAYDLFLTLERLS